MRSVIAIFAGYLSMFLLEGFIRVVIGFYHRAPLSMSGFEGLPGLGWIFLLSIAVCGIGIFGGLMTTSIVHTSPKKHIIFLALFTFAGRTFPALVNINQTESIPTIFLGLLSILGIYFGYIIKLKTSIPEKNEN